MAKLKLLKMPKAPKLPKKPALSASLSTKQSYIRRVNDMRAKFHARCNSVKKENAQRISINKKSEQASKVIAGIGSITVRPSAFKTVSIRKKRTTKIGSVKRKTAKRKTGHKTKATKRRR